MILDFNFFSLLQIVQLVNVNRDVSYFWDPLIESHKNESLTR
jgi:hypothetical protein